MDGWVGWMDGWSHTVGEDGWIPSGWMGRVDGREDRWIGLRMDGMDGLDRDIHGEPLGIRTWQDTPPGDEDHSAHRLHLRTWLFIADQGPDQVLSSKLMHNDILHLEITTRASYI